MCPPCVTLLSNFEAGIDAFNLLGDLLGDLLGEKYLSRVLFWLFGGYPPDFIGLDLLGGSLDLLGDFGSISSLSRVYLSQKKGRSVISTGLCIRVVQRYSFDSRALRSFLCQHWSIRHLPLQI